MTDAGDALLDPRLLYDSDHDTTRLETNAGNVDHDQGTQGNGGNEAIRKEVMNEAYRNDGLSTSSDRLISGDFHSMEPEVIMLNSTRNRGIMWRVVLVLFGLLIGILLSMLWRTAMIVSESKAPAATSSWRGWKSIEHTFIL